MTTECNKDFQNAISLSPKPTQEPETLILHPKTRSKDDSSLPAAAAEAKAKAAWGGR